MAAATTAFLAWYALCHRDQPGTTPFSAAMVSMSIWSGCYAVSLTQTGASRLLWERLQWLGVPLVAGFLFLFILEYTGYESYLSTRGTVLLFVIPVSTVLLVLTNPLHELVWTEQRQVITDGVVTLVQGYGPWFWVLLFYNYALITVGGVLLVRLVVVSDYLYIDQAVLLVVGIVAPLVGNILAVLGTVPIPGLDVTPYAFTVTGVAFGYALFRRQLFDLVPATRQLGRNSAINQLDAGVVIVDDSNRIVYINTAAEAVLGCDAADAIGQDVKLLADDSRLDFDTEDALAEVDRGDRVYEVRTSPVTDRRDRHIGNTLVIHDVTARKERERRLAKQRDELEAVNDLNAVIRGVNQALVSALSREQIEETVCERVAAADLYQTALIADIATWKGETDRWTVAGSDAVAGPPALDREFEVEDNGNTRPAEIVRNGEETGTWTVVPLVYGRTVYGALGLYTKRESISDRERSVLGELGELIGNAINAVETRQLLSAEVVVELAIECTDPGDPLVAATTDLPGTLELEGLVPAGEDGPLAYLLVSDVDVTTAQEALAEATNGVVRTIRDRDDTGLLEWKVTGDAPLNTLIDHGASVTNVSADGGRVRYDLDIASESNVRTLVDTVAEQFADIQVLSKHERTRSVDDMGELPGDGFADLTDRQHEALEAAYRAGYFNWPRDSNAEEVAETLDISSATLHSHLRKAEDSILGDLFNGSDRMQ